MRTSRTLRRLAATTTAVAVLSTICVLRPSAAQTGGGSGTSTSSQSVLDTALGDLLGLNLLKDSGDALTRSSTSAQAGQTGLALTSSAVPGLNAVLGQVLAKLPGGKAEDSTQFNLTSGLTGLLDGLPAVSNLVGTLTGLLSDAGIAEAILLPLGVGAKLGDRTSQSTGTSKITDLDLLSGLINVKSLTSSMGQSSKPEAAAVARNLDINALGFLNLGDLLDLAGLNLGELNLPILSDLLGGLGLNRAVGLQGNNTLNGVLTPVLNLLNGLLPGVGTTVSGLLPSAQGLLGGLLGGPQAAGTPLSGLAGLPILDDLGLGLLEGNDLLGGLLKLVTDLLNSVLGVLGDAPLINLSALKLGASANATSDVKTSSASANCTLDKLQIGNLLPVDLSVVTNLVGTVGDLVRNLPIVGPLLGNVIQLAICGKPILGNDGSTGTQQSVTTADGVVTAKSSTSALSLNINLAGLTGGLGGILGGGNSGDLLGNLLGGVLGGLGGQGVQAAGLLDDAPGGGGLLNLGGLLGGVGSLLTKGLSVDVGKVQAQSTHAIAAASSVPGAPATPAVTGPLARTGRDSGPIELAVAFLLAMALAGRSVARRGKVLS